MKNAIPNLRVPIEVGYGRRRELVGSALGGRFLQL